MSSKTTLSILFIFSILMLARFNLVSAESETGWYAHYYNNSLLQGEPALSRVDPYLRFYWGNGKPAPEITNSDYFSARWTKLVEYDSAKTVVFSMRGDDGYKLFVDGDVIINNISGTPLQQTFASVDLEPGSHSFYIEYYEHVGNASVDFQYYVGPKVFRPNQ